MKISEGKGHRWHGGRLKKRGEQVDEILEILYMMKEDKIDELKEFLRRAEGEDVKGHLEDMLKDGLISMEAKKIRLKGKGEKMAEAIIRRHRLAERLFADLFEFELKQAHRNACAFEHILSPEVTDSVCTFLGHPPICPDGRPIPRGECCKKFQVEVKPLVQPLTNMQHGKDVRIVFITPRYHARLDKLGSLGIMPGSIIRVHQRKPSFVVEIGETEIAIDEEIAKYIYVREA